MDLKKRRNIIILVFSAILLIIGGTLVSRTVSAKTEENNIVTIKSEFLLACEESFADIFSQTDCVRYGLSDFGYSIIDCVRSYSDITHEEYYLVSLRIDCTTSEDINETRRSLIAHEANDLLPDDFVSSTGNCVSLEVKSYENDLAFEQMVYIYVNGEITRQPEAIDEPSSSSGIECPNCGAAFRYDTVGANMISKHGYCHLCNGRGINN